MRATVLVLVAVMVMVNVTVMVTVKVRVRGTVTVGVGVMLGWISLSRRVACTNAWGQAYLEFNRERQLCAA